MAKTKVPTLDPQKLREMTEPLLVHVERDQGNQSEVIPIPAFDPPSGQLDPEGTPGTNWTIDAAARLAWWLRDYWTGGGSYRAVIVDATNNRMEGSFVILPKDFPMRPAPQMGPGLAGIPSPLQAQPGSAAVPASIMHAPSPSAAVQQPSGPAYLPWTTQQPLQGQQNVNQGPPAGSQQPVYYQQPAPPPPSMRPGFDRFHGPQYGGYPAPGADWMRYGGYDPVYGMGPLGGPGYPGVLGGAPATPTRDRETEDRLKDLEARLNAANMEKVKLEGEQQRKEQQAVHEREMAEMRAEMRRLAESGKSAEGDELRRMREQLEKDRQAALEAQMKATQEQIAKLAEVKSHPDDDRIRRIEEEAKRRDEEHRREMEKRDLADREERMRRDLQAAQEKTNEAIREMQQQAVLAANSRPDPMLEYMKETSRTQMEFQRQIAELNRTQNDKLAAFMVAPHQLAAMIKENSGGQDAFLHSIIGSVTGVVDMYRSAAERLVGLSGGGQEGGTMAVVDQITNRVGSVAEKMIAFRRDAEVSGNKAKAAEASAQETAIRAQAEIARLRFGGAPGNGASQISAGAGYAPQPAAQAAGGLSGAAGTVEAQGAPAAPQPPAPPSRASITDEERFGHPEVLKAIKRLRYGVEVYLQANGGVLVEEAKRKLGPDNQPMGLDPDQTFDAVMKGIEMVEKVGIRAPAFDLYQQEMWADFVDILIPKATPDYKAAVVQIFAESDARDGGGDEEEDQPDPELAV